MNREEKAELIKKLNSTFNNAGVVVVTHQSGLTVEESTDLRVKNEGSWCKISSC